MDFNAIRKQAEGYEADMTKFLRDLVAIPGESADEKGHADRIKAEMEKVGFDEAYIDGQGNVIGFMGTGKTLIAFDGHIDTVGIGNLKNWEFDPYKGYESDTEIGGRGTSDQMGGPVSAVYGAKIMKDLGLLNDKYRVMVVGSVQE
ncbi:MAG: M20/M25/M40 family metallo-hydrolase, partial [Oscillospiraceae bacterium]